MVERSEGETGAPDIVLTVELVLLDLAIGFATLYLSSRNLCSKKPISLYFLFLLLVYGFGCGLSIIRALAVVI